MTSSSKKIINVGEDNPNQWSPTKIILRKTLNFTNEKLNALTHPYKEHFRGPSKKRPVPPTTSERLLSANVLSNSGSKRNFNSTHYIR